LAALQHQVSADVWALVGRVCGELRVEFSRFVCCAVDKETARHEDVRLYYEFGREIGRGGFSVVVEGAKKGTNERYAIKCIKKSNVERDDIKLLRREIQIMKAVDHPNILKVESAAVGGLFVRLTNGSLSCMKCLRPKKSSFWSWSWSTARSCLIRLWSVVR
jgi:serine/threonine protein kinase